MKAWVNQCPANMLIAIFGAIWVIATLVCTFIFGFGAIALSALLAVALFAVVGLLGVFWVVLWECFHRNPKPIRGEIDYPVIKPGTKAFDLHFRDGVPKDEAIAKSGDNW